MDNNKNKDEIVVLNTLINYKDEVCNEEFKTVVAMLFDDLVNNRYYSKRNITVNDFLEKLKQCKVVYRKAIKNTIISDEAMKLYIEGYTIKEAVKKARLIFEGQL